MPSRAQQIGLALLAVGLTLYVCWRLLL